MRFGRLIAAAVGAAVVAGGCSSTKPASSGNTGTTGTTAGSAAGGGQTVNIGVLSDLTGPAASSNVTFLRGINAGVVLAKREGFNIKYVTADTQTSPAQATTVAQGLVDQDHATAVLVQSAIAFAAAPFLHQQNEPVVGVAEDGGEWATDLNMFPIDGALHPTVVTTTPGRIFKLLGVTTVGTLGYSISPSSSDSARGTTLSAKAAGLRSGYENPNFPFGSTNTQPVAIAMKGAGVDGFYASVDPNTSFALITALRQAGAQLKAALLPTGYGADTTQAGPGALQAAQNVYFTLGYQPVDMNTPATRQFKADLAASGTTTVPTYAEYNGYLSVALLVRALKTTGPNPSHAALITALGNIHNWDAEGLWGGLTADLDNRTGGTAPSMCSWVTKLVGQDFKLVPGADPICGTVIPGVTAG